MSPLLNKEGPASVPASWSLMTNTPLVSVVIPTYNRAHVLHKAIDSVLNQTFTDFEIIVVNDGSTDNTTELLNRYGHRIRRIYQDNSGVSAARNAGINCSTGKWVAFLDSDDEWKVNYLDKQMDRAARNPGLCMQTTNCLFVALTGETQNYFEINGSLSFFGSSDYLLLAEPFSFVVEHGPWQVGSTIVLRHALIKAGLFDRNLTISEDFDLMARVSLRGAFGLIRDELVNIYRRKEGIDCLSNQAKKNPLHARQSGESIYEKLSEIETLKYSDRRLLKTISSANRRAIGNLLVKAGNTTGARESFRRAFQIDRSITSLGKYALSFLPRRANKWLSEKYRGTQ